MANIMFTNEIISKINSIENVKLNPFISYKDRNDTCLWIFSDTECNKLLIDKFKFFIQSKLGLTSNASISDIYAYMAKNNIVFPIIAIEENNKIKLKLSLKLFLFYLDRFQTNSSIIGSLVEFIKYEDLEVEKVKNSNINLAESISNSHEVIEQNVRHKRKSKDLTSNFN